MAKITTKKFKVAGKTLECGVWYTASDKFFLKGFPPAIERAASIAIKGSPTEEELYEKYEQGIARYEEMIARSRKVIVFSISAANSHLEEKFNKFGHNGLPQMPDGISETHYAKMGFTINYEIKMLREVGESYYLHNINEEGNPMGSGEEIKNKGYNKIINYTPEREQAFKELHLRFDKLLEAFISGFSEAEKFIDSIPKTRLLT